MPNNSTGGSTIAASLHEAAGRTEESSLWYTQTVHKSHVAHIADYGHDSAVGSELPSLQRPLGMLGSSARWPLTHRRAWVR